VLDRISIGLKTFLRDDKLFRSLRDIRRTMPEMKIIVADDGEQNEEKDGVYADLIREGHKVIILPFDSGFGKKSNAVISALDTEFLLVSSDDFAHDGPHVRLGIEKMLSVLDRSPGLSIVSGRLANRGPYEFHLVERQPGEIYERPLTGSEYFRSVVGCDVTVNYSLIRRNVFWTEGWVTGFDGPYWQEKRTQIGFDDEEIIGEGGHGAFFYDVKKAGLKVAYVPGVEISEQTGRDSEQYRKYRYRACGPSRKCFEKRGIKKWVLGNGQIDYDVTGENNVETTL
jgi:hypothetical protein